MEVLKVSSQAELDAALASPSPREIWICGTGDFVLRQSAQHHLVARDQSHVEARESSHVVARESSHVEAWESSHVEARESSHVVARESSHVVARGSSHVVARGSSHVVARESSHVEAWESSHVEARESSHVEARGSSHVEAWESSHVVARGSSHVVAWESSHVEARESSHVVARGPVLVRARDRAAVTCSSTLVVVMNHATTTSIDGGTLIQVPSITTVEGWCEYYGIEVVDGVATLYKGVRADYRSAYGFAYTPGTIPVAPDWDGGQAECGGGLHFSPRPIATKDFDSDATKFLACPVRLTDIRVPNEERDSYPSKLKARGCCAPIVEVNIFGQPITGKAKAV